MRRLAAIPAFALLLALPLWAQHGGGHGGGDGHSAGAGGGHASFSGGASGGFSSAGHAGSFSGGSYGVHAYSGPQSRSFAPRSFSRPPSSLLSRSLSSRSLSSRSSSSRSSRSYSRPFSRPPISQNRSYGAHTTFRSRNTIGLGNYCYGYACRGYGYYSPWAYGYYDPYWLWDSGSSYDGSSYNDNGYDQDVAAAAEMNQQSLDQQQMMRQQQEQEQEQADGDQDRYAQQVPMRPTTQAREAEGTPVLPNTVLVFRDEHKQEIRNYAIAGQTLWNFSPQHTQKIPLSDLDLPATTKANEDRGLTFRVPVAGEGQ